MIVFGGYDGAKSLNDIQSYDAGTGDWKELVGRGKAPSPRFGHSAVVYQHDKMYIFGGYDGVDRNDLYCFDFELMQWNAVLVKQGNTPPPRQYHSAVVYEDEMFVFGGKNGTRHYHDLHAFHFRTQSWRAITAESVVKPWPRAGHTAVAHGSLMLIFGGMNGKQNFNDLSVYSIRTNRWTVVAVEGELPAERRAHAAVISNGGHLCIFGGSDGTKRFDDIYSFDLAALHKQFEEENVLNETQAATTTPPASAEGEPQSFTPTTPPPKEWRQSRARMDTTPVPVSPSAVLAGKNERRGTVSQPLPADVAATAAAAAAEEGKARTDETEGQSDKQRNGEKGDEDKGSNAADKAQTKTESEETDRDERRKKNKEKKKKEKSDIKRREREEKALARRSRQVNAAPENGTSSETAAHESADTNAAASAAAAPPPAVPAATDPSPVPHSSSSSSSSSPASPATQTSAAQTSPKQHSALASTSTPPTTPVKLEERSNSRIALLKARFDASGSPTSGSPVRNLSRRSVAYPLSHQSSPSFTADNDAETRSTQNAEVEKLQKEMTELRSKLEERDREVAALKERMDARDAELRKVADGVTKQMRKMKRDLKKLKAEKGKKSAAESSDDKGPKKGD